ncbi:hypothetical protein DSL72_005253 [Monilinia vaccinii-corymbosi]|uniref:Uncharacterized protein n=1 Tax=Monilinia vaccinii-corymbosi TaxID=61207 RepID=A0A8A3PEN4_9HELO|nr:hypothetical protein DSL72_005253 [Monilinia vaccinii-corymbosi]
MSLNLSSNPMGTCPLGGLWWTCEDQSPTFLGCCLSNPCNGIGCPAANLTAAGMGTGSGRDASTNDGTYWPNTACPNGGTWYTCSEQTPSFQGCCNDDKGVFNPCHENGCPTERLYAAAFSSVPALIPSAASSLESSSLTTNPTFRASSTSETASNEASGIDDATAGQTYHTPPIGAIVGSALGGGAVVLLAILALFCLQRRRKRAIMKASSQTDMSTIKVTPSQLVYEAASSEIKVPPKGYHPVSHTLSSPPLSPAPPYQSAPQSPGSSDHHELDSMAVHEAESPPLQQRYTCTAQTPTFLGCCTSNPCNGKGCPVADLRAAGLGLGVKQSRTLISDLGSYWPNVQCSSGQWWTCSNQNPSFQGCFDIDPCSGDATNCPQSQPRPAAFKYVTTASNFKSSLNTAFKTARLPTAIFLTLKTPGAMADGQSSISRSLSSARTMPLNLTASTAQAFSSCTKTMQEPTTASALFFQTSSSQHFSNTGVPNTSTLLRSTDRSRSSMTAGASIARVTFIMTFTTVQISVHTEPHNLSHPTHPSGSSSIPTASAVPTSNSFHSSSIPSPPHAASSTSIPAPTITTLPSGTIPDSKIIAWGATSGVAFILIFALTSWWIRRHHKKNKTNSAKTTAISSFTWLPWKKTPKEIPRASLATYPFSWITPATSTSSPREEMANGTSWSAPLTDDRNHRETGESTYDMNDFSRNRPPSYLSGYESHYSQPFYLPARHVNEDAERDSRGVDRDRNAFG